MSKMVHCFGCGKEIHETATSCPSCGAVQSKVIKPKVVENDDSKPDFKWSWWTSLMSVEYASRGMVGMGMLMAFVNFFPPSIILSSLILKKKSIRDLSTTKFNWNKGAVGVMALQLFIWLMVLSVAKQK